VEDFDEELEPCEESEKDGKGRDGVQ